MSKIRSIVIMAGGRGERFWPQSRKKTPKHLLPIVGDVPMLAQTVARVEKWISRENIWVITNVSQVEQVKGICPGLNPERIVAEPVGRDTAAAVGLAALLIRRLHPDSTFAILPADHVIQDEKAFQSDLEMAFEVAEREEALVTLGIQPEHPATGYGYIEKEDEEDCPGVYRVRRFVEKPNQTKAKEYLKTGRFFWNAGMFVWTTEAIWGALHRYAPALAAQLKGMEQSLADGKDLGSVMDCEYPKLEKVSIDYAVLEKATNVRVVVAHFDWDDVGEWPAVERHEAPDENGNVVRGPSALVNSSGNIVRTEAGHLVALVGVEDLIIVHTDNATLVCPKSKAQDIKQLVQQVEKQTDGGKYL